MMADLLEGEKAAMKAVLMVVALVAERASAKVEKKDV